MYVTVSFYGCTLLQEGLDISKMLSHDSDVYAWHFNTKKYTWPVGEGCAMYIMQPPDFTLVGAAL